LLHAHNRAFCVSRATLRTARKGKKNQPRSFGIFSQEQLLRAAEKERTRRMAEHKEEPVIESVMDKVSDKLHGGDSSSSSDSDDDKKKKKGSASAEPDMKAKIYRLFGRERPVHSVLGGGKRKSPDS
jgi:hypothetical protein